MPPTRVDPAAWRQHAWRDPLLAALLLAAMAGYMALLGWLLWGADGVLGLLLACGVVAVLNPRISPRLVMRLYGAVPLQSRQLPGLYAIVARLSERAGLPAVPQLHYLPSSMLNAFAVGRPEEAAIAVTDGLLRRLDSREAAAVLAHEISHIRNNDLWVMGLADLFSRATSMLSLAGQLLVLVNLPLVLMGGQTINWPAVALLVFAPGISALTQLALSRNRELDADLNAVRLTGDPRGLARALAKIERVQGAFWERLLTPGRGVPEPSILRTHPDTRERIARLEQLDASRRGRDRLAGIMPIPEPLHRLGRPVSRPPRWHITGLWH